MDVFGSYWQEGYDAYNSALNRSDNPYREDSDIGQAWDNGFTQAGEDD